MNRHEQAITHHVAQFTQGADLGWVAVVLHREREAVLARWLDIVADQPFHAGHRDHAVADHIPALYDALVGFLTQGIAPQPDAAVPDAGVPDGAVPLDDAAIRQAAEEHARTRLQQGLRAVDVVTEFRLLRQEIVGALRQQLPDAVPTGDVLAAGLLINDALDGAMVVGLGALTERVDALREEFLATTTHDVRQPLTLIKAAAQVAARRLRRAGPEHAATVTELQRIDTQATRMALLLTNLAETSRIALRQLQLERGPVDLAQLVQTVTEQLGPEAAGRVHIHQPPGVEPTGVWDRSRLEQVVTNLLSNAAKYAPADTPITVTLRREDAAVELSVRDEGIGVAAEDLPRIFERYGRGTNAVAQGIEGQGLGLYLCRGIVEAHGGRIWATSPGLGQGMTIHLVLPR